MTLSPQTPRPRAAQASDVRPVVASQRSGIPIWVWGGIAVLLGVVLFGLLNSQRLAATAPSTKLRSVDQVSLPPPLAPLYIPALPAPPEIPTAEEIIPATPTLATASVQQNFAPPVPSQAVMPDRAPQALPNYPAPAFAQGPAPAVPAQAGNASAALIFDASAAADRTEGVGARPGEARTEGPSRDTPTRLQRPSLTVPQGTLIPAVLETALDSTRPGIVRAIVSQDVAGFDGSHIVIPRGTRLFGEYQSDMAPGQRRALVQWTRLVRPDGVAVTLASPAADRQGRAGIAGRVDSHFIARFGASFLQSVLNLGTALAGRSIGGDAPIILNATGAASTAGGAPAPSQGQATLRVEAGARVAVLVARDLEFLSGERRR